MGKSPFSCEEVMVGAVLAMVIAYITWWFDGGVRNRDGDKIWSC